MPGTKIPEQERRAQILWAAAAVAAHDGLSNLTVRKVAAAAGSSVGLVFFHFATMEALREALLDRLLERVLQVDLAALREQSGTPRERLLGLLADELAGGDALRSDIAILLEFWVQSRHEPALRERLQAALSAYAAAYRALVDDVLEVSAGPAVSAAAVNALLVRSVLGFGLEQLLAPAPLDAAAHVFAAASLVSAHMPAPDRPVQ